jgi:hypothetical protein
MSTQAELPQTPQELETAHLFQMTCVATDAGPITRLDIIGGVVDEGFDATGLTSDHYQAGEEESQVSIHNAWHMTKIKNSGHLVGDSIVRKGALRAVRQLTVRGNVLTANSADESFANTADAITELKTGGRGIESTTYATIIGSTAIGRLGDALEQHKESKQSPATLLALSGLVYAWSFGSSRNEWAPGWQHNTIR